MPRASEKDVAKAPEGGVLPGKIRRLRECRRLLDAGWDFQRETAQLKEILEAALAAP